VKIGQCENWAMWEMEKEFVGFKRVFKKSFQFFYLYK
jgi:hypothetical protein